MSGLALEKHLLAERRILRARGSQRTRKHEGSENLNLKICHWPIRRFCI
jgi:hypothetical protein